MIQKNTIAVRLKWPVNGWRYAEAGISEFQLIKPLRI